MDAPTYLGGVWAACRVAASAGVSNRVDGALEGATWVRESVEDIHALEASGEFDAVVACVGAGVRTLAGVKDIASLRLVRGQSLLYDNTAAPAAAAATAVPPAGGVEGEGGARMLDSAVLCGQYVVPSSVGGASGNGGKLLCGSTQEPVLAGEKVDKPANMGKAMRQLRPKAAKFFPAIEGAEPVGVTSGVSASRHGCMCLSGNGACVPADTAAVVVDVPYSEISYLAWLFVVAAHRCLPAVAPGPASVETSSQ